MQRLPTQRTIMLYLQKQFLQHPHHPASTTAVPIMMSFLAAFHSPTNSSTTFSVLPFELPQVRSFSLFNVDKLSFSRLFRNSLKMLSTILKMKKSADQLLKTVQKPRKKKQSNWLSKKGREIAKYLSEEKCKEG